MHARRRVPRRCPRQEDDKTKRVAVGARAVANDHATQSPQVLALEITADHGQGKFSGLVVRRCRQAIEVGPDPVGQCPEELIDFERVGAWISLELLVFEACQCRGAQALTKHDLLDCKNALDTEISTPAPNVWSLPQCDQFSVPSRRSSAGENWNDLSLRMASARNLRHSRCLAPGTGVIGSCPSLSAL